MDIGGAGTMAGAARVRDCVMPMVTARLRGYRSGVHQSTRAASIPIYECKEAVMDEGRRAFQEIMAAQPRTTAILAMSDLLAIGVIEEARNQGLHVPDDLSVVGFDDIHLAANIDPPLTTIRQPHVDKGRTAARMLLDQIETGVVKKPKIFPVELVVRKSTALVSASRARAKEASRVTGS
jgi:DNA-binding LacI/PurR family transcriptional regulator